MGQPAARITDFHACPAVTPGTPPVPHVGGPVVSGSGNVITGKLPQARVTDKCVCVGPPDVIVKGSATVFVNNLPAARMGDMTAHGGTIAVGCFTVLIGDAGGAGGSGGLGIQPSLFAQRQLQELSRFLQQLGKQPLGSALQAAQLDAGNLLATLRSIGGYLGGKLTDELAHEAGYAAAFLAVGLVRAMKDGVTWSNAMDLAGGMISSSAEREHYGSLLASGLGSMVERGGENVLFRIGGDLAHEVAVRDGASPWVAEFDRQLVLAAQPAVASIGKYGVTPLAAASYAFDRIAEIAKASGTLINDAINNFNVGVKQADQIRQSADALARQAVERHRDPTQYYQIAAAQSKRVADYYTDHPIAATLAQVPGVSAISAFSHTPLVQNITRFL